jgi:hypothetical protein
MLIENSICFVLFLVDIMHQNRFSLHCALLPVRDSITRLDKGNRVKLHTIQYRAANFMILMEDLSFHAHTVTGKKLGAVAGWIANGNYE